MPLSSFGIGGGESVLILRGKRYPFTVLGMSVGFTIGASTTRLVRRALNLKGPASIEGTYSAVSTGGAAVAGGGGVQLQNANGVILQLSGLRFARNEGTLRHLLFVQFGLVKEFGPTDAMEAELRVREGRNCRSRSEASGVVRRLAIAIRLPVGSVCAKARRGSRSGRAAASSSSFASLASSSAAFRVVFHVLRTKQLAPLRFLFLGNGFSVTGIGRHGKS